MPDLVTADKMSIGGVNGGKHWTALEVSVRQENEEKIHRKKRISLKPPQVVKDDPDVFAVWKEITRKLKGVELLDNLDTDLLAAYCDSIANYRDVTQRIRDIQSDELYVDLNKQRQAEMRIMVSLARELGLTPGGRARLAKKKAEKTIDAFAEKFE